MLTYGPDHAVCRTEAKMRTTFSDTGNKHLVVSQGLVANLFWLPTMAICGIPAFLTYVCVIYTEQLWAEPYGTAWVSF